MNRNFGANPIKLESLKTQFHIKLVSRYLRHRASINSLKYKIKTCSIQNRNVSFFGIEKFLDAAVSYEFLGNLFDCLFFSRFNSCFSFRRRIYRWIFIIFRVIDSTWQYLSTFSIKTEFVKKLRLLNYLSRFILGTFFQLLFKHDLVQIL